MKKIRLYLADDHAILRDGLKRILSDNEDVDIIGESGDGKRALEDIDILKPDLAILDISMPLMTGLEVARQVRKYNDKINLIILSRHDNEEYVQQALQNGINGYILKDYAGDELLRAVKEVVDGNVFLSPKIINKITADYVSSKKPAAGRKGDEAAMLSNREREILKLVAEGKTNTEIGSLLRISSKTVKVHRLNIMNKLDIHNITDLVKYAIKNGLVEI